MRLPWPQGQQHLCKQFEEVVLSLVHATLRGDGTTGSESEGPGSGGARI